MLQAALRLLGVDLQQQGRRIAERVEEAKQEFYREVRSAITELKAEAVGTGINIGLVIGAAQFAFLALVAGLVAMFLWLAPQHGPLAALLAIGLAMLLMACVLLAIAKLRSSEPTGAPGSDRLPRSPIPPEPPPVERPAVHVAAPLRPQGMRTFAPLVVRAAASGGRFNAEVSEGLAKHGAAAADELAAMAEDVFRTGSRKAMVGTILVTMLAGAAVGWRWRR